MARVITISGELGSGKTLVSRALAARIGYQYLSTGQLHRDIAREMGINAVELNIRAESDASIDDRVDAMSRALADGTHDCVVDSRIAWHFIPFSLKVYLTVDSDVAAKRVLADRGRLEEPKYIDLA